MKKSELYYMAQIAVINAACIAPERKLQILRALMADEDSEKYFEELAEKKKLKSALTKRYGVNVELNCLVDKSILGGMIIKTEDSVTDGSLKTKIRDIKDVIKA